MTVSTLPAALMTYRVGEAAGPGLRSRHAWRTLLESRWGERLIAVTTLSLAYHDAAELSSGHRASRPRDARQARRLMGRLAAARRALSDTEDALARLTDGSFGRCEQCAAPIRADHLERAPETRYCPRCV
jgi:RNA polymerase-binding transcription factor DksA